MASPRIRVLTPELIEHLEREGLSEPPGDQERRIALSVLEAGRLLAQLAVPAQEQPEFTASAITLMGFQNLSKASGLTRGSQA